MTVLKKYRGKTYQICWVLSLCHRWPPWQCGSGLRNQDCFGTTDCWWCGKQQWRWRRLCRGLLVINKTTPKALINRKYSYGPILHVHGTFYRFILYVHFRCTFLLSIYIIIKLLLFINEVQKWSYKMLIYDNSLIMEFTYEHYWRPLVMPICDVH